ncbi:hypothetical protein JYT72_03085 [Crocinitomix catalasitica]|nr:hypothetical protein [Crocinitomix catalasitica]
MEILSNIYVQIAAIALGAALVTYTAWQTIKIIRVIKKVRKNILEDKSSIETKIDSIIEKSNNDKDELIKQLTVLTFTLIVNYLEQEEQEIFEKEYEEVVDNKERFIKSMYPEELMPA